MLRETLRNPVISAFDYAEILRNRVGANFVVRATYRRHAWRQNNPWRARLLARSYYHIVQPARAYFFGRSLPPPYQAPEQTLASPVTKPGATTILVNQVGDPDNHLHLLRATQS